MSKDKLVNFSAENDEFYSSYKILKKYCKYVDSKRDCVEILSEPIQFKILMEKLFVKPSSSS